MKKTITIISFLLLAISTFFCITTVVSAKDTSIKGADVNDSIVISRDNGKITFTVSGKLTKEGADDYSSSLTSLYITYRKLNETDTLQSTSLSYSGGVFGSNDTYQTECTVIKKGSKVAAGDTFTCKSDPLWSFGTYIFAVASNSTFSNGLTYYSPSRIFNIGSLSAISPTEYTGANISNLSYKETSGKVTVTGTFDAETIKLAGRYEMPLNKIKIAYGKVIPLFDSNFGVKDWSYQAINVSDDKKSFSVPFEITDTGRYVFTIMIHSWVTGEDAFLSPFVPFSVETGANTTSVQLVSPVTPDESDPQNPKVTIKVLVNNITETGDGYIQLGHIELIGGSSNGRCVLDPSLTSDKLSIDKGGAPMHMEATFSGASKLTPGIYCIGAKAGSMEEFTSFTSKGDWFKIGNVVIPDTLTIDPNANQFGCVIPEGEDGSTTGYCLLAPLPGVGDETGYVDTSSGIEKYINSLIRLVLGLITVLSVLMIVVGGIEYMSTVNIGEKEGAKHRITQALLGLMVAIGSYAILNTINPNLVNITIHIPGAKIDYADNGETEDFEDPTAGISNTKPPVKPPTDVVIPDGDAVTLAKKVLENSNINLLENIPGRNEVSSGPKQNVTDTVAGKSVWRSSWGDKGHTQTNLSPKMLAGLLAIADKGIKIQVNALAGGDHASNSPHYQGLAFDLQASTTDLAKAKQIMGVCFAAGANYTGILGPCNNVFTKGKTTVCQATGYRTNEDHQTHIHCNWPGGTTTSTTTGGTVSGGTAGSCGLPTSKSSDMCEGVTKNCAKYAARIDELVKDPKRARFMKLNMVEESRCISDSVSPPTDSGYAYGIFQQQPETAKANVAGCGVSASQINGNWLRNENNIDKIICIQENLIKKLEAKCGTNIRNLGAGQHGIKWCEPSDFCSADKSCVPGNTYVMKWECPWNNKEHTELDSLAPARESSKQMQYCSDHPGSWMK